MSATEVYYVLRGAERRCVGRVHGADHDSALAAAKKAHPKLEQLDVERATQPPSRLAAKLARMATRHVDRDQARRNHWQKRRDAQFDETTPPLPFPE
jgi:hypothetical protein